MICKYCGQFPFCEEWNESKKECEKFIKRPYTVEIHRRKESKNGYNEFGRSERIIR